MHRAHPGKPITIATAPNQLWSADFRGQFKTLDGIYCYPLTVTDSYSRYILSILALSSSSLEATQQEFRRLFQTYRLPDRIRTDNGTPFASIALERLSTLSSWWIRLGIRPDLIEPGHPEQNGRSKPWTGTLKTLAYPVHYEIRVVSKNSGIRWKCHWVSVTHRLAGKPIGLEEVGDGVWDVWYGPVWLGR